VTEADEPTLDPFRTFIMFFSPVFRRRDEMTEKEAEKEKQSIL